MGAHWSTCLSVRLSVCLSVRLSLTEPKQRKRKRCIPKKQFSKSNQKKKKKKITNNSKCEPCQTFPLRHFDSIRRFSSSFPFPIFSFSFLAKIRDGWVSVQKYTVRVTHLPRRRNPLRNLCPGGYCNVVMETRQVFRALSVIQTSFLPLQCFFPSNTRKTMG